MKTNPVNLTESAPNLPDNLRSWLGERALLELALDAVQMLAMRSPSFCTGCAEGLSPPMMATLLTYCYAAGIYDTEQIEWATSSEPTVKYICAREYPRSQTIRKFRKANRQWIEQCLMYVLIQALVRRLAVPADEPLGAPWLNVEMCVKARDWARRKLELAVMMDTAANE
jgi:hypothetical protein